MLHAPHTELAHPLQLSAIIILTSGISLSSLLCVHQAVHRFADHPVCVSGDCPVDSQLVRDTVLLSADLDEDMSTLFHQQPQPLQTEC